MIVSGSLDLPFDAPIFTCGAGRVVIFTSSDGKPPETETTVEVEYTDGPLQIESVLKTLLDDYGIRAVLCEGGPHLFGQLEAADAVDDFFLTTSPELIGGEPSPRILEGALAEPRLKRLEELLEHEGELFARYRRRR